MAGSTPGDRAAGKATVYKLENSGGILRLEDFSTTNGRSVRDAIEQRQTPMPMGLEKDNYLLAALKGNRGNQNYELPGDIDLGKYKSVVIWCRTFNVVFGYAALQPAA
ncbi:MAG: DM13 domain-containing protein [Kouleothrix sp.]